VKEYKDTGLPDSNINVLPGQVVLFDEFSDVPLQQDSHRDLMGTDKVFVMHRRDICAIL